MHLNDFTIQEASNAAFAALKALGGSAKVSEIRQFIIEKLKFSADDLEKKGGGKTEVNIFNYRVWDGLKKLKKEGLVDNYGATAVWTLTSKGVSKKV